jgi:hypothetical protein
MKVGSGSSGSAAVVAQPLSSSAASATSSATATVRGTGKVLEAGGTNEVAPAFVS